MRMNSMMELFWIAIFAVLLFVFCWGMTPPYKDTPTLWQMHNARKQALRDAALKEGKEP